jgi:DNA-binding XRE family transcriptional regulator
MTVRGTNAEQVADALGHSRSGTYRIRNGRCVPTIETAAAIAEHLDWPSFLELVKAERTRSCEVCGAPFVDGGRNNTKRSCGIECQRTRHQRIVRGRENIRQSGHLTVARNRLEVYQAAVDDFCRACCPEGVCDRPTCELRPVSPLQLARVRAA